MEFERSFFPVHQGKQLLFVDHHREPSRRCSRPRVRFRILPAQEDPPACEAEPMKCLVFLSLYIDQRIATALAKPLSEFQFRMFGFGPKKIFRCISSSLTEKE